MRVSIALLKCVIPEGRDVESEVTQACPRGAFRLREEEEYGLCGKGTRLRVGLG